MEDRLFEGLADGVSEGVFYVTNDHTIVFWNKRAEVLSGYSRFEVTGMPCSLKILHSVDENRCDECDQHCPLAATLNDGRTREVDAVLQKKGGEVVPAWLRCSPVRDSTGTILGAIEVFAEKRAVRLDLSLELKRLRHEAATDQLTGVANRRHAEQILRHLQRTARTTQIPFGVLFLDIDRFKGINDQWGHQAGDAALRHIAKVIQSSLRSMDSLARWGGEEFLVAVPGVGLAGLAEVAERVRLAVQNTPLSFQGKSLSLTLSAGVSQYVPGEAVRQTVRRADALMYDSKRAGRNRVSC